jgi:TAP-like protein
VGSDIARRTYPEFVGTDASAPWSKLCKAWNVPDLSEQLSVDVASQVPTLLLRGSVSPYGDPQWIDQLARGLPNATVATFPTLGNDLLVNGPRCVNDLRRQFLADPTANIEHAAEACVAKSPPIQFAVPGS